MRCLSFLLLGAAACVAPATQTTPSPAALPGSAAITAAELRRDLFIFAVDTLPSARLGKITQVCCVEARIKMISVRNL